MPYILLGALLVIGGVLYLAVQVIQRGALSTPKGHGSRAPDTLEPPRQGSILTLKGNWPGYVLITIGAILLLAASSF